jgi:hypothetical protein
MESKSASGGQRISRDITDLNALAGLFYETYLVVPSTYLTFSQEQRQNKKPFDYVRPERTSLRMH